MAAAELVAAGKRVIVVERGDRAGRKVLASGGGRCNFTHESDPAAMAAAFAPRAARFLKAAMYGLPPAELRQWFALRGVASMVEPDGSVFTASGRAGEVLAALVAAAIRTGTPSAGSGQASPVPTRATGGGAEVRLRLGCRSVIVENGRVAGIETDQGPLAASAVILAAGGLAWPNAGGSATGLEILKRLGHTIVPPRPGLAPLYIDAKWLTNLQGISVPRVRLTYAGCHGGRRVPPCSVEGPIVFTHFGLSGPAALDFSLGLDECPAEITLSLLPDYTTESLEKQFLEVAAAHGRRQLDLLLATVLPRRIAQEALAAAGIAPTVTLDQLRKGERRPAVEALTRIKLRVQRLGDWSEAMVTVGGCELGEIDPKSLASRKVAGLYVVGELLDLAGPTGGYNLHAAFATGRLAARAILNLP
jgi:hypothetical protein